MDNAMKRFVQEHDGEAILAILAIGREYGIGVAYVSRGLIEAHLENDNQAPLSADEWARLKPHIEAAEYDDYISEHDDLEREFIKNALAEAGVVRDY